MRVLAVDYGDARTGVAVSDATRTLTGDAWIIHSRDMQEVASAIAGEAANRNVSCIVVGYPRNMDGTTGERANKSGQLADLLKSLCDEQIEVVLRDERLTTVSAHRILSDTGRRGDKRKQTVDAVAASLILESYLSSLQHSS